MESRKRAREESACAESCQDIKLQLFPLNVPIIGINGPEFESGFDENLLKTPFPSNQLMCCICKCYPRSPCYIVNCGHFGCEYCLTRHFTQMSREPAMNLPFVAPCPVCKENFRASDLVARELFNMFENLLFNSIEVKCPQGCGYVGNCYDLDVHEVYSCPLRKINCPNIGCNVEMAAKRLEQEHFPNCEHAHNYCNKCYLAVPASQLSQHDCIGALKGELASTHTKNLFYLISRIFFILLLKIILFN